MPLGSRRRRGAARGGGKASQQLEPPGVRPPAAAGQGTRKHRGAGRQRPAHRQDVRRASATEHGRPGTRPRSSRSPARGLRPRIARLWGRSTPRTAGRVGVRPARRPALRRRFAPDAAASCTAASPSRVSTSSKRLPQGRLGMPKSAVQAPQVESGARRRRSRRAGASTAPRCLRTSSRRRRLSLIRAAGGLHRVACSRMASLRGFRGGAWPAHPSCASALPPRLPTLLPAVPHEARAGPARRRAVQVRLAAVSTPLRRARCALARRAERALCAGRLPRPPCWRPAYAPAPARGGRRAIAEQAPLRGSATASA